MLKLLAGQLKKFDHFPARADKGVEVVQDRAVAFPGFGAQLRLDRRGVSFKEVLQRHIGRRHAEAVKGELIIDFLESEVSGLLRFADPLADALAARRGAVQIPRFLLGVFPDEGHGADLREENYKRLDSSEKR